MSVICFKVASLGSVGIVDEVEPLVCSPGDDIPIAWTK